MVRETRHLWVGNLPENIREDRIREHFKRYGRVQSVKLLPRCTGVSGGEEKETSLACTVAFMDIKSASKAHNAELKLDDRLLSTEYYEPAAVPSGSGDQDAASFAASPGGAPRFPNGHSSAADEHWPRTTSTTSSDDFLRRGYHDSTSTRHDTSSSSSRHDNTSTRHDTPSRHDSSSSRRTSRDRTDRYRAANGPYIEGASTSTRNVRGTGASSTGTSSGSGAGSWSSYESTRYNSTGSSSQADTGYSTTPTDTNERRSTENSKKKTKSRSGSRSASPSGSTSSRSISRSRSRSSSTSSTSSSTSSSTTAKSRRTANHQPTDDRSSDDHRGTTDDRDRAHPIAHAICVRNLPLRSSDTSLKDGLFHEYKKHGKVTWVKVVGQNSERHAIVCFKKAEDVEKALEVSYDGLFFGCKIEVAPYQGYDVDDNDLRPYEAEIDEYHPKATRTLFIGNLEKDVTASDLRKHFDQFGEIIEIDIKKQGAVTSYAFCQYTDITSVVKAIRKMDGEHLGNNRIKLGFGKSMPYNCVWIDGINENVNEKYLRLQFEQFGVINKVHLDRDKGQALIFYEQVLSAQTAVQKMRGFMLKNTKIQVDFASRECQEAFFERLEKQGTILDRGNIYDERRESSSRSFEASAVSRFSRYETPTRPRTSSYSSRSSVSTSQVSASMQSPGTPGSLTPRGAGSRRRFADYYDSPLEYPDRHFRNYDEYSQGSAASHEDVYEHEYTFIHDSPTHIDALEARALVETGIVYAPPDIRNLQKERVHLLEQLEECPSSGDELMSPKKRLKLDLLESGSDVIIEANRDHRKVMEVRRLSDANLKHHSRRPSIDSGKHSSSRDISRHDIGYLPHAVCKRRKTASSDSGSRIHHYDLSGSESVGGSRPGTPLCGGGPGGFQPGEPRRVERREREGPLTLPLPRFAAQVMNRGSVSVAGIKGQKDVLSSPPPAVTSPRISNPRPPGPIPVPPPASPPPRPPSLSSNSSDSDITPPSPSLEERIRSLDEKYEKWSGSRALSAAGGDALALLDANLEKFRQRHKLLDLDLKEVQPSEIVKSVMAKRSVFDEDLKRLENVGEKYEPKEFSLYPRVSTTLTTQTSVPATPLSAPPTLKLTPVSCQLPKTPTMLSPRSSGTSLPAAKGLQYPFPTHPPTSILMSPVLQTPPTPTTSAMPLLVTSATSGGISSATITRGTSHGENRLKLCATVSSSDTRTSSKVTVNRSSVVAPIKVCEKTIANIPNAGEMGDKSNKTVRETKSSDKTSEKISSRRDSSNSSSPRADVKTRRNSDTSARRIEDSDGSLRESEHNEERKKERFDKIKLENERLEKERLAKERIEKERLEKEKQEKERLEKERLEKDRLERESELEKQRLEKERLEKEKLEKERLEREQLERERQEKERLEKEQAERERLQKEKEERERKERERKEKEEREKREREQQERDRREKEEKERKEREERERRDREERERRDREEQEKKDREEQEKMEREKLEREKLEKVERERKREEEKIRHKEDNHEKRNDHKHREIHSETKHKDNHIYDNRITKECSKEEKQAIHELSRRDSNDSRSSHDKFKHHADKDIERRKDSIKENRDNNTHDKHKFSSITIESRHLSMELDKNKSMDSFKQDPIKRKERNNSLPANIGSKRRVSAHDSIDIPEESKKVKLGHEHKKLSERRDSRDSNRSDEKSKSGKHKNNSIKSHDKHSSKEGEEKRKDKDREERHKKHKLEKQKSKSKSCEKDSQEGLPKSPLTDKDFLARLDLRATEEVEKQRKEKESKLKIKEISLDEKESKIIEDKFKKEKQEKTPHFEKQRSRTENEGITKSSEEKKKRDKSRKTNSSESDSDEPKKHSIFDIVDDEPAYISMYDKVKARSCKNMAKQEEEKRQEKIKAKFSQLKQSRAKREEKKRSTSWDEDSDSEKDHSEVKVKRCPKILFDSSDDESQDRKSRKKKDIYSDSDSSAILRPIKQEQADTSEDEVKNKQLILKTFKPRLSGDLSEDEYSKKTIQTEIKSEMFSDVETTETQDFGDVEEKQQLPPKIKEELGCLVKKERRNSKHQEIDTNSQQIFSDHESKSDKFNNKHSIIENTSDEETTHELSKKERREKKHKKKQKKQKHSISGEDISKHEETSQTEHSEKSKHHEKKKDYSKREKKREKNREGREKSKKSKKNKSENKSESKREGKMENIFGLLSDDSEHGAKDLELQEQKSSSFIHEESQQPSIYNSESEREHDIKPKEKSEKERDREEHRRKKEKKRREKERRLQAAAAAAAAAAASAPAIIEQVSNENSMDFADMGKQLEENMLRDDSMDGTDQLTKDLEDNFNNSDDPFKFSDVSGVKKEERREGKEKKKKRKKSKDEKSKHHHHHHHDKNKVKSENKKEELIIPTQEIKIEIEEIKLQDPSLPSLTDEHSSSSSQNVADFKLSPANREMHVVTPVPTTPVLKEKKRDKFIPGFGTEIDEKLHESAVKSISEFEIKKEEPIKEEECQSDKNSDLTEEKTRVVISQEETEDAVAALLGESFGGSGCQFEESYDDEINNSGDQPNSLVGEPNVQDDEEMRQAVQSLSATDLDVKPDTPQSEHELQIDTDTEEQEDISLRFDQPPKTPETTELPQPQVSTYFHHTSEEKSVTSSSPLVATPTSLSTSPPSLTPIKPQPITEIRKVLDVESKSLPLLPEQNTRTVISQPWPVEKKQDSTISVESSVVNPEHKNLPNLSESHLPPKIITASPLRQYSAPPVLKITESTVYPPLQPITKSDPLNLSPATETTNKILNIPHLQPPNSPSTSQLHNLPARSPVQNSKPPTSIHDTGMLSPKVQQNLLHSRLPITPVMASKPLQATTVILQQSKVAHSLEPPKLVATSDHRPQERPRMVFQTSTIQPPQFTSFSASQPRMLIQGNIRHLPPQGLLVPTRQLPPHSYSYLSGIPQSTFNLSPVIKENTPVTPIEKKRPESPLKTTASGTNLGVSSIADPGLQVTSTVVPSPVTPQLSVPPSQQPLLISKSEHSSKPSTPSLPSPNTVSSNTFISVNSPKPFAPASVSPKPPSIPVSSPSPKPSVIPTASSSQSVLSSTKSIETSINSVPVLPSPTSVLVSSATKAEESVSQPTPKTEPESVEDIPKLPSKESLENQQLLIPIQEQKTSIPSPVITAVQKEEVNEIIPTTVSETKKEELPTKLAIEEVTEELNLTLGKEGVDTQDVKEIKEKEPSEPFVEKPAENVVSEIKAEPEEVSTDKKPENIKEDSIVIKDIEKFDEEKMETESVISDISKERSTSADILAKDDPLDTKEDSDYWSAKEVNIDSVIKTLCSADELSDHSSENGKDDWFDNKVEEPIKTEIVKKAKSEEPLSPEKKTEEPPLEKIKIDELKTQEDNPKPEDEKEPICLRSSTRTKTLRGRGRGKTRINIERGGIQTRRGKLAANATTPPAPPKRGRGGRMKSERKSNKSESDSITTDVYEFRDEPDEASKEHRPRLILTIKSPAISNNSSAQTTAIVKEVTKDGAKEIGKEHPKDTQSSVVKTVETKEEFASPTVTNTRKSRRLQEKDISRNTVDDTIEDVVKNTVQTRSNQRRSTRQATPKQQQLQIIAQPETPRKSHRGRKTRRGSEAAETSSSEETSKEEIKEPTPPPKEIDKTKEPEEEIKNADEQTDKPIEGLKAAFLRRMKGEMSNPTPREPTNLIDPVTGELIPMRECEEGKYIPLPGTKPSEPPKIEIPVTKESPTVQLPEASESKPAEVVTTQPSVIAQPQPINVVHPPKPQSFKTHILSSQVAQAAQLSNINQQIPTPTTIQIKTPVQKSSTPSQIIGVSIGPPLVNTSSPVVTKTVAPVVISKAVTPIVATKIATPSINKSATPMSQHLNVNINLGMNVVSSSHLSPRPNVPLTVAVKPMPKQLVKPPVLSPVLVQKQQILQQVSKQQLQISKSHLATPAVTSQTQIVNTQLAHMKHQPVLKQQVIMSKGPAPMIKPTHLHQQILTAAVPSPPLSKSQSPLNSSTRIIQVPAQGGLKGAMDPPKVDVSMANVMLGQRPKLSPQGSQARHVGQAGMPVPGYEASLGEAITHFPPGPLRPPPDLNPAHYMHPSHVMQYQQYLQQQGLLSRSGGHEKIGDGQEGEEAPVTSPPLELRRPGSVGLALTGRGAAVPHSLHSPHDRVTDSPQVGQVYNVHSARMQHYHSARYYDQAEPPPAHRPMTSHGSLTALSSRLPDRPLSGHITPIPDRPLSGHSLTPHMTAQTAHMGGPTTHIERPLSAHGLMGATLGAAGNLMGAVARHIGADTPTSQRGLQAATPPHASQVPPQAESLFMLLKQYPCMWQGLLALKNDQAAVQMYFVSGNDDVAKCSLPKNTDGSTPPLRIFQRMRLEQPQVEGVARKMQMENEHCMLLALPCGHDHMDVLKQSTNLTNGFITYLQHKQAAGIVNVAAPGTTQPPAYVVHIFPSCDFVNENLRRIAPSLLERVADIAHLLIVITTV